MVDVALKEETDMNTVTDELFQLLSSLADERQVDGKNENHDFKLKTDRICAGVPEKDDLEDEDEEGEEGGDSKERNKKKRKRRPYSELNRNIVCPLLECQRCYASKHALQLHMKRAWEKHKCYPSDHSNKLVVYYPSSMMHGRSASLDFFDPRSGYNSSPQTVINQNDPVNISLSEELLGDIFPDRQGLSAPRLSKSNEIFSPGSHMGTSISPGRPDLSSYNTQSNTQHHLPLNRGRYRGGSVGSFHRDDVCDINLNSVPEWNKIIDDMIVQQIAPGSGDIGSTDLRSGSNKSVASRMLQQQQEVRRTSSLSNLQSLRGIISGSFNGELSTPPAPQVHCYHTKQTSETPMNISSSNQNFRPRSKTCGGLDSPMEYMYSVPSNYSRLSGRSQTSHQDHIGSCYMGNEMQIYDHGERPSPMDRSTDQPNWDSLICTAVDTSLLSPNVMESHVQNKLGLQVEEGHGMEIMRGNIRKSLGGLVSPFSVLDGSKMDTSGDIQMNQQESFDMAMAPGDILFPPIDTRLLYE